MLRAWLLLTVWGVLALPVGIIALPWTALTRNAALLYRWGTGIGAFGLRVAGVRARVHYVAPLPLDTPCLFLVNHASNIDPPLLTAVLRPRRTAMLIKRELLRIPLLGWGMQLAGFVAVARSGSVDDAKRSLERAAGVLHSGVSLTVFVEGTRSPDGRLLPFKKGPFFLAMESGVPVVPVTLSGTSTLLPKGSLRLKRGTVDVVFHRALLPSDFANRDELRNAVREAIASGLPQDKR